MSDKVYAAAAGIVQFDVKTREVNNQTVRDITIKTFSTQKLVSITVWPEFDATAIKKGDFVAVDGAFSTRSSQKDDGSTVDYHNISAGSLVVVPSAVKAESSVVSATPATATNTPAF